MGEWEITARSARASLLYVTNGGYGLGNGNDTDVPVSLEIEQMPIAGDD